MDELLAHQKGVAVPQKDILNREKEESLISTSEIQKKNLKNEKKCTG